MSLVLNALYTSNISFQRAKESYPRIYRLATFSSKNGVSVIDMGAVLVRCWKRLDLGFLQIEYLIR